jgi:hypothetical protein
MEVIDGLASVRDFVYLILKHYSGIIQKLQISGQFCEYKLSILGGNINSELMIFRSRLAIQQFLHPEYQVIPPLWSSGQSSWLQIQKWKVTAPV